MQSDHYYMYNKRKETGVDLDHVMLKSRTRIPKTDLVIYTTPAGLEDKVFVGQCIGSGWVDATRIEKAFRIWQETGNSPDEHTRLLFEFQESFGQATDIGTRLAYASALLAVSLSRCPYYLIKSVQFSEKFPKGQPCMEATVVADAYRDEEQGH